MTRGASQVTVHPDARHARHTRPRRHQLAVLARVVAVLAGAALAGTALATPHPAAAAPRAGSEEPAREPTDSLLLIVDFSGSMLEPDGRGSTRIAAATQALETIVDTLPEDLNVGLRLYGHRVPSDQKEAACRDTELVVPVGPLDRDRLRGAVGGLEARGETPVGLSLLQAADDLPADRPGTVVLVSDGADECFPDHGPEPCQAAQQIVGGGRDLRLETVGLQVEPDGREQLECIAEVGGGEFTAVEDAGLLAEALATASNRSQRTFELRGEPVAGGPTLIDALPLAPGVYQDGILEGESLWYRVDLAQGEAVTARATVRTADVPREAMLALEWQDENARRIDATALSRLGTGQANTLAVGTGEVDGSRTPFGAVRDPGPYYLAVRVAGFPAEVSHDFVLELVPSEQLETGASPSATRDAPATASPAPTDASAAGGDEVTLPPAPESSEPGTLVVAVILLVLAGLVGYLLLRRRASRAGQEPPTY